MQVGRIQVFNNWSPYMVADRTNTVWIGLEYFVNEGEKLWNMADARSHRARRRRSSSASGSSSASDVLDGCVLRMPKAYPAYFGTYDRLDVVREWRRRYAEPVPRRPQRHAPLQQPGPLACSRR